jgi:hypothetical protein
MEKETSQGGNILKTMADFKAETRTSYNVLRPRTHSSPSPCSSARPSLGALDPRDQSTRPAPSSASQSPVSTLLPADSFDASSRGPIFSLLVQLPLLLESGRIVLELEVIVSVFLRLGICGIATRQHACSGAGHVQEWRMSKNKYLWYQWKQVASGRQPCWCWWRSVSAIAVAAMVGVMHTMSIRDVAL